MNRLIKIPLAFAFAIVLLGAFAWFFASDPARLGAIGAYDVESRALAAIRSGDVETGRRMLSTLAEGANSLPTPAESVADSLLNLGNAAYGSGEFSRAREYYLRSGPMRIEGEFRRLHNLGNTEYRLGESERGDAGRILLWSSAIERYEAALAWREDRETRENLEFVKKKLQDMQEKKKTQKNQTASSQGQSSGSGSESSGSGSDTGGQGGSGERVPQSGGIWRNTGEFDKIGGSDGSPQGLSESERAGLEQRMRSLDELNKDGQGYLRRDGTSKVGQDGTFFGTIPFFEDSPASTEKDW